jgi:hypothetical protein
VYELAGIEAILLPVSPFHGAEIAPGGPLHSSAAFEMVAVNA